MWGREKEGVGNMQLKVRILIKLKGFAFIVTERTNLTKGVMFVVAKFPIERIQTRYCTCQ